MCRQCIALRGHREDISDTSGRNPGNFLALLKLLAEHNIDLKQLLETVVNKKSHVTYLHHKHQNELIDIIGYRMIQQDVLDEVKRAGFHSIMVDEASSFNKELISLCFRFVDSEQNIGEEFLDFIDTERTDGLTLFNKITNWCNKKAWI